MNNKILEKLWEATKMGVTGLVVGAILGGIAGGFVGALIFGIPMGVMLFLAFLFM
jgi:hypothetical protein